MEVLKILNGFGINLVMPAVLVTVILTGIIMYVCKGYLKKKKLDLIRTILPVFIGFIVYLLYAKAKLGLSLVGEVYWDGLINGIVSVGAYAPLKSYLSSKGINIGIKKKK